jgi:hypothetical protein
MVDAYEVALSLMDSELRAGNGLAAAKIVALRVTNNPEAVEKAAGEIARRFKIIEQLDPAPISSESGSKWYTGPKPGDVYWPAYFNRLQAGGWTEPMIEILDRTTTRIVGQLEAPGNLEIDTKGLVIFCGVWAPQSSCNGTICLRLSSANFLNRPFLWASCTTQLS